MLVMPTRSEKKAKPTAVRINADLLDRLTAIGDRAPYKPTMTQLIEAAIAEYVANREKEQKQKKQG